MRHQGLGLVLAMLAAGAIAGPAQALTVNGTSSIYQIFGHDGNTGGDYGPATNAILASGSVSGGDVFIFSATGTIGCCSGIDPTFTSDGSPGGTNVVGINGLSSLTGNSRIPLVGVFTTNVDPFGGSAPATLNFDSANPAALAPLLNQVFYIGDGRTGFNDGAGGQLSFTAPTGATRLYLGVIDAFSFGGTSGYYNDNPGAFEVSMTVRTGAIPEPATWAMAIAGFALIGAALRHRRPVIRFA